MIIIVKKKRITKHGEPIRKFNKKDFVGKTQYAYKKDALINKKQRKENGYLIRITKIRGGFQIWSRHTPKSRKYEKEFWNR